MYERTIDQNGSGKIIVNNKPLLFFHFAGFDIKAPQRLTKYGIPHGLKIIPDSIEELSQNYYKLLIDNGHETTKIYPYAFAKFENGKPITPLMRRFYFKMLFHDKEFTGSPFGQYEYFSSRLHLQNMKNNIRNFGKYGVRQIGKFINPDHDFDKP